jgi:hypothetical protein
LVQVWNRWRGYLHGQLLAALEEAEPWIQAGLRTETAYPAAEDEAVEADRHGHHRRILVGSQHRVPGRRHVPLHDQSIGERAVHALPPGGPAYRPPHGAPRIS